MIDLSFMSSDKSTSDAGEICQTVCARRACKIQDCLAKNNYKESKCEHVILQWKECCDEAMAAMAMAPSNSKNKKETGK